MRALFARHSSDTWITWPTQQRGRLTILGAAWTGLVDLAGVSSDGQVRSFRPWNLAILGNGIKDGLDGQVVRIGVRWPCEGRSETTGNHCSRRAFGQTPPCKVE